MTPDLADLLEALKAGRQLVLEALIGEADLWDLRRWVDLVAEPAIRKAQGATPTEAPTPPPSTEPNEDLLREARDPMLLGAFRLLWRLEHGDQEPTAADVRDGWDDFLAAREGRRGGKRSTE